MVRSSHHCVVDDEPGRPISVVQRSHSGPQTFWVACVGRDCVDVGSGVSQGGGELVEAVGAASNQGDSVPIVGETTSHGFAEAGPGADQQQVTAVD